MTNNQPRELFIYPEHGQWERDAAFTATVYHKWAGNGVQIHVLEAGPMLEKIKRLEAALQKCKEKSMELIRYHSNERFDSIDAEECEKELESILEGR